MTAVASQGPLTLTVLPVPEALDSPGAARFTAVVHLGNLVARHDAGHDHLDQHPAEALAYWHDQTDRSSTGFLAERGGRLVGAVTLSVANEAGATAAEFDLLVRPEHRGGGVEEALLAAVEQEARLRDRGVLQTWTLHRPDRDGARLTPSTGWGAIPADDQQSAILLRQGFSLEQVERTSAFDLSAPLDRVAEMFTDAVRFAGDHYRLVTWSGATPPHYLDSYAEVHARMSTDAPQGGMDVDEEVWDAARVIRRDARFAAGGLFVSVAAVEHLPTGRLVAYNELAIGEDRAAATQQYGTLVLREHRGRRLGTLIKCANLLRWRQLVPGSPRVSTFNAEENRPMLDVNEAIGFVPVSYAGAWRKVLS